ncbi:EAL domain-containing protein [Shewanella halifaxensis]|uniref:EAL domain-containing protein n=1 Tax=Shewanella halifaxensis TaxID=271098 RepID=UPI000D59E09A|nr:EAL domain-containing protein [Shewanella halifaxensis]
MPSRLKYNRKYVTSSVLAGTIFIALLAISLGLSHFRLSHQLTEFAKTVETEYQKRLVAAKTQMVAVRKVLRQEQVTQCSQETIELLKNKLIVQNNRPIPWVRFNDNQEVCSAIGRWPEQAGGKLLSRDIDGQGLYEGADHRTFNKQKTIYASLTGSIGSLFIPVQSAQEISDQLASCNVCGGIEVEVAGKKWISRNAQITPFFSIEYQAIDSDFKYTLIANESVRNQLWLTIFLLLLLPTLFASWSIYLLRKPIYIAYWHKKFSAALKKEAFYLAYQPIIDTSNNKPYSVEALLRWQSEDGNHHSTSSYIRYLEQDSIMPKVTRWMIKTALVELKSPLLSEQISKCSINISAKQIERDDIVAYLRTLAAHGYSVDKLSFELTERQPISSWEKVREFITGCKQLGCLVKLDDVGTGYSGGLMLQQLEFDCLKIDKAFTKILVSDVSNPFLIRSYIAIAKELEIGLIAEGVETLEQADRLKALGIHLHQGWFYSKALPAAELRTYLLNH